MNTAKTTSPRNTTFPGAQAVVRALRLLKLFESAGPSGSLSMTEIRERVELNRSTALRLVGALESEGMLARDPHTHAYRLGPQIASLGRLAASGGDVRALALPEMERLHARTEETVTLEKLVGAEVLIVAETGSEAHVLGARSYEGTTWPAHATSTGKVLLADLDAEERDGVLRGRLRRMTERTIVRKDAFTAELARVDRRGHALSLEELELGYVAVAVPVRGADGRAVAALSVGGPAQRLPRARLESFVSDLGRAAGRITRSLEAGPHDVSSGRSR